MLNRIKIIQRLLKVTQGKNYLEIGVNNGACFLRVKAANKFAVDPAFRISGGRRLKYMFKNPTNFNNKYFEQTSDIFFAAQTDLLQLKKPKVVLVDGLHTYEQSLRDVLNSLDFLDARGVILMHDCNPLTETSGFPADSIDHAKSMALPEYNGIWNGDVWKVIVHLRSLHPELEVFVLDCDHGIGVIKRGRPKDTLHFTMEQVKALSYKDLVLNRSQLLNLKPADFFDEFIQKLERENEQ